EHTTLRGIAAAIRPSKHISNDNINSPRDFLICLLTAPSQNILIAVANITTQIRGENTPLNRESKIPPSSPPTRSLIPIASATSEKEKKIKARVKVTINLVTEKTRFAATFIKELIKCEKIPRVDCTTLISKELLLFSQVAIGASLSSYIRPASGSLGSPLFAQASTTRYFHSPM